ncbi:MAG: hypothetical protein ACLQVI_10150 [Polyangiaceae bacterium]
MAIPLAFQQGYAICLQVYGAAFARRFLQGLIAQRNITVDEANEIAAGSDTDASPDGPAPSPIPASGAKPYGAPAAPPGPGNAPVDDERTMLARGMRAAAARGGLSGAALAEFQRMTGTAPPPLLGPQMLADGTLRIVACTPTAWRAQEAARRARGGR